MSQAMRKALSLRWTFGFNHEVQDGVFLVGSEAEQRLFYPAAQVGVLYDIAERRQILLQGHCAEIVAAACSSDRRWIATADSGADSLVVVWDARTGEPARTIFEPHPRGTAALDFSHDGAFLAVVSAAAADERQAVQIFEWHSPDNNNDEDPLLIRAEVPPLRASQSSIRFNPADFRSLVTTGPEEVLFWAWAAKHLVPSAPTFSRRDFRQKLGSFSVSVFLPGTNHAVTATTDGAVVLWDNTTNAVAGSRKSIIGREEESVVVVVPLEKHAIKVIRLCQAGIKHLSTIKEGPRLVVGAADGAVRIYDFLFRLEAWYEDINAGAITSVSFAATTEVEGRRRKSAPPVVVVGKKGDSSKEAVFANHAARGPLPDFVVGTSAATIVGLDASCFEAVDPANRRGVLLVQGLADQTHAVAAHPNQPLVLMASHSGAAYLWDYNQGRLRVVRHFEASKHRPQTFAFDPSGTFVACGFHGGAVRILHGANLTDAHASFKVFKGPVLFATFSPDGQLLAAADATSVALWRLLSSSSSAAPEGGEPKRTKNHPPPMANKLWVYIGRFASHARNVTALDFGVLESGAVALVSLGADRVLHEYDLDRSSVESGLCLVGDRGTLLDDLAVPSACVWYPRPQGDFEDRVLVATDDFKLRQWNMNNKQCRNTTLGPTHSGPITHLEVLFTADADFLVYAASTKVVGLIRLPFDGNPNKAVGTIAHPGAVARVAVSNDGLHVFTAGGADKAVHWCAVSSQGEES